MENTLDHWLVSFGQKLGRDQPHCAVQDRSGLVNYAGHHFDEILDHLWLNGQRSALIETRENLYRVTIEVVT